MLLCQAVTEFSLSSLVAPLSGRIIVGVPGGGGSLGATQ